MKHADRREFLRRCMIAGSTAMAAGPSGAFALTDETPGGKMRLGLVTYLWGRDWDLPTLLANCQRANVLGVELRTTHAHGVEPSLDAARRREVKQRFDDSPVTFVGPGSNERFDHPDPTALSAAIERAKAFVQLSHDCGGSGVKVKPNSFQKNVPRERTIEQIGRSLNEVGAFASDLGQEVRLEVHGECSQLPTIRAIMDVADHPSVGVCWNCNGQDLEPPGLEHNFDLVKERLGATTHVRELNVGDYPYAKLIDLLVGIDYAGWVLLECRTSPADRVPALIQQREGFEAMLGRPG